MKPRVLIVDDEIEMCEVLSSSLARNTGAEVFFALNGRDGIVKYGLYRPSLVVSDLCMPRGDGIEFSTRLASLSSNGNSPSFILISAFNDMPIEDILANKANAFFPKPFDLNEICEVSKRLMQPYPDRLFSEQNQDINGDSSAEFHLDLEENAIGRFGFFFPGKVGGLKTGMKIRFKFVLKNEIKAQGVGRIAWVREKNSSSFPSGVGVEFLSVDRMYTSFFNELLKKSKTNIFIPQTVIHA